MEVFAKSKYLRVAPLKARSVGRSIKGLGVESALATLEFLPHRSAPMIARVLKSAVSNAENNYGLDPLRLYVSRVHVDEGPRLKRMRAKARGRAGFYVRMMSHITVVLDERVA